MMKGKIFATVPVIALLVLSLASCSSGDAASASEEARAAWEDFPTETLVLYDEVPTEASEIPTITPDELYEMIEAGEQIAIVDVNSPTAYSQGHIPGAVNVPWDISGFTSDPDLPRGVTMVFYCSCAAEEDSGEMALSAITSWGYRNIVLLKGGNPAWEEAGYEIVS